MYQDVPICELHSMGSGASSMHWNVQRHASCVCLFVCPAWPVQLLTVHATYATRAACIMPPCNPSLQYINLYLGMHCVLRCVPRHLVELLMVHAASPPTGAVQRPPRPPCSTSGLPWTRACRTSRASMWTGGCSRWEGVGMYRIHG